MSEPINNPTPTPAPAPEPTPEKTFTQAEVDAMIGKRLAKAMKGMPSEEELTDCLPNLAGWTGRRKRTLGQADRRAGHPGRKADLYRERTGPVEARAVCPEKRHYRRGSGVYRFQGRKDGG